MSKFFLIVGMVYVLYYMAVIGYQLFTAGPGIKKEKQREVYSVTGAPEEIPVESPILVSDEDVAFSDDAVTALKKNEN